jgi:DNA polymerase-3 subunit beta
MTSNAAVKMNEANMAGFKISKASLMNALGRVQSVVERRNTIPVLGNVKIEVSADSLRLVATDMDVEISEQVSATLTQPCSLTTPAHTLYDIVRKLSDVNDIDFAFDESAGKLFISSGNSRFTLPTLPASDFPEISEGEFPHNFKVKPTDFMRLFDKTRFAMSTEETRYYLNGIYLHVSGDGEESVLRTVATDGHRLARNQVALPSGANDIPGVIVPRKTVNELKKLAESAKEDISVSLSTNKVKFKCGEIILTSKLIDGAFPDYNRVIPSGNDKIMEVEPKAFASAIDRVSTVSSDKVRGIRLNLSNNQLKLSSSNSEHGTAEDVLDVTFGAETIEVGFNARYLLDVLDQIEGEVCQFVFADSASPVIIRDASDLGPLYVIMPMRI